MTHFEIGAGGLAVLSLALVPALVAPTADKGSATRAAVHMKCGPQPEGTTALVAIDGVIQGALPEDDQGLELSSNAERPLYGGVDREDLFWVQIVCMDRRDSTFHLGGNGIPVASVWTKQGPVGRMSPALEQLVEEQEQRFETYGAYARDLAEIESFRSPDRVEIELDAGPNWWLATARTERFLGQCTVGGGTAGGPPEPRCGG